MNKRKVPTQDYVSDQSVPLPERYYSVLTKPVLVDLLWNFTKRAGKKRGSEIKYKTEAGTLVLENTQSFFKVQSVETLREWCLTLEVVPEAQMEAGLNQEVKDEVERKQRVKKRRDEVEEEANEWRQKVVAKAGWWTEALQQLNKLFGEIPAVFWRYNGWLHGEEMDATNVGFYWLPIKEISNVEVQLMHTINVEHITQRHPYPDYFVKLQQQEDTKETVVEWPMVLVSLPAELKLLEAEWELCCDVRRELEEYPTRVENIGMRCSDRNVEMALAVSEWLMTILRQLDPLFVKVLSKEVISYAWGVPEHFIFDRNPMANTY